MGEGPSVAIVMPAYNAAHLLPRSLTAAIEAAQGQRVLVVDPGSTDDTAEVARALGAEVIRLPKRAGPAHARNVGVERIDEDVVLFIDSDCVAHPDVIERVQAAFRERPDLVSVTGSYDDHPPEQNFFSLYMNLRHHVIHQKARTEDASFWAGCGAVKRSVFVQIGGFDAEQFPMPMIEDIELGLRLAPHGAMRLDPALHVTHLKRWTFRSVVETDIKSRAIPWTKLILATGKMPNDLNLHFTQRIAAAIAPIVLAAPIAIPLGFAVGAPWFSAAVGSVVLGSMFLQRDMLGFFTRTHGIAFGLGAWFFHQAHLVYSAATYVGCVVAHKLRG